MDPMTPRGRCRECTRRRVLKHGLCRDCLGRARVDLHDAYLVQFVRLEAGKAYRDWSATPEAPVEMLLRRAYTSGYLTEVIESVFRSSFEMGFMAYPGLVVELESDLEEL